MKIYLSVQQAGIRETGNEVEVPDSWTDDQIAEYCAEHRSDPGFYPKLNLNEPFEIDFTAWSAQRLDASGEPVGEVIDLEDDS